MIILPGIQEELDLMQQILDGKKLREVASDSSRIVDVWVERAPDTLLTGRIVMYSNGIMMSRLFPRKVINESWKSQCKI